MSSTNIVNLEQFKPYIKESMYDSFVEHLRNSFSQGSMILFSDSELLGGIVSPDTAKEMIYDGLKEKILRRPETLSSIMQSLESDDIVE